MADPMNLPQETRKREKEEEVVRDPTSKKFWRLRNIAALALTALLPLAASSLWSQWTSLTDSIKTLSDRVKELERDKANNQAIWDAIADIKNRQMELQVRVEVHDRLVDKVLLAIPEAPQVPKADERKPIDPVELRKILEQKYPQKR